MAKNGHRSRKKRTEQSQRQMKRIDVLPDDVLIEIFNFYVDVSSWNVVKRQVEEWQSLVHVCRRSRSLVFQSPRHLNLQLFCTPKIPVRDTLDVWPALPLIVVGYVVLSSDTDNVIAALGQSNRVCRVELGLGDRRLEDVLATMQVSFPELTYLQLFSQDETPPVLPDSFLDGSSPSLRHFVLDGIPFPGLPKLLLSSNHLVRLSLDHIPRSGYFSPEDMVALLSVLSSLRTLTLRFQSPQSFPDWESRRLPSSKRSILPALDVFRFRGVTRYLEDLVTFIDTPQLHHMDITFLHQIDFGCPRLAQFINRTPLRALREAHVQFDDSSARIIHLYHYSHLEIEISCREPDLQLLSIAQVCNFSLPPPSAVEDLYIEGEHWQLVWENDAIENTLWLELLLPFTAAKDLYLSKSATDIAAAALHELVGGRITEVLPSLQNIFVEGLELLGPFQENIRQFLTARQLSDHPIAISSWDRYEIFARRFRENTLS